MLDTINKDMSLRDTVKDWLREGKEIKAKNPLCSKRLVIKNLNQIHQLLEEDSPMIAKMRIEMLIDEIEDGKLNAAKASINKVLLDKIGEVLKERAIAVSSTYLDLDEEEDTAYQKFFRKALKKFGVSSPSEFKSEEEKKKFFDYVDKEYKADNEED